KGEKTAAEIARENDVAPTQICEWKKQLEERLCEVFQSKGERSKELQVQGTKEARLERKIGQLVIEKDFLLKKCKQLGMMLLDHPPLFSSTRCRLLGYHFPQCAVRIPNALFRSRDASPLSPWIPLPRSLPPSRPAVPNMSVRSPSIPANRSRKRASPPALPRRPSPAPPNFSAKRRRRTAPSRRWG